MPVEWIEDADAETDRPRRQRARGEAGHRPAPEGILSEPHRGEPGLLRRPGLRRAFPGRKSSVNTEGDARARAHGPPMAQMSNRKSTRLNSSHVSISYAVFCLKKKKTKTLHDH